MRRPLVYIAYMRGYPQGMHVFSTQGAAWAFVQSRTFPKNYIIHKRAVIQGAR